MVDLTGDDAHSMKCILDALKGHCRPRSNEIVAAKSYKQLVKGDVSLPEYVEKYNEVTVECNFRTAYNKCPRNAILLGLRKQCVYDKHIKDGDKLTSADVIWIASEVNNSEGNSA